MTKINTRPNEGSTLAIEVGFAGVNAEAFTPKTCTWTLSDAEANIINNRENVSATVTGSTHVFVLSGDDLPFDEANQGVIIFTVEGTFDATYGTDLSFREQAQIIVSDMVIDG